MEIIVRSVEKNAGTDYSMILKLKDALLQQPDNTATVTDEDGEIVFDMNGQNITMNRKFFETLLIYL